MDQQDSAQPVTLPIFHVCSRPSSNAGRIPLAGYEQAGFPMSRTPFRNKYVPLNKAYWSFAPRRLRDELRYLEQLPPPKVPDASSMNLAEGLQALSAGIQHAFLRTGPAIGDMREHLVEMLRHGDLEARGLRTLPNVGEMLEAIPLHYFDHPKIVWEKNTVEKFGRRYEAVEVRRAKVIEVNGDNRQSPHAHSSESRIGKKKGRPSTREAIAAAIAELERAGIDLGARDRKDAYHLIKECARKAGQDTRRGFSDPVINTHLGRHLRQNSVP